MRKTVPTFLVVLLMGIAISSPAQKIYRFYENYYFSGNIGVGTFYGDVSDKKNRLFSDSPFSTFFYEDRGAAFNIDFGKNISPSVSAGFSVATAKLFGNSDILGMYMESNIYAYGAYGRVHALNAILGADPTRPLDIYVNLGVGGLTYNTYKRDQLTDTLIGVNNPEIPNYNSGTVMSSTTMLFNYGFGVGYQVADQLSICFETSSNLSFDDRLDAHLSEKRSFEGFGLTTIGLKYHFDSSPYAFKNRYPKYNGKSKDPAIKQYNKKKAVVMDTKQSRKALRKRHNQQTGKDAFSFRKMFRRTKLNFAK